MARMSAYLCGGMSRDARYRCGRVGIPLEIPGVCGGYEDRRTLRERRHAVSDARRGLAAKNLLRRTFAHAEQIPRVTIVRGVLTIRMPKYSFALPRNDSLRSTIPPYPFRYVS
jgi:hypothetical protein